MGKLRCWGLGEVKGNMGKCAGRYGKPQHTFPHTSPYFSHTPTHFSTLTPYTLPHFFTHTPISLPSPIPSPYTFPHTPHIQWIYQHIFQQSFAPVSSQVQTIKHDLTATTEEVQKIFLRLPYLGQTYKRFFKNIQHWSNKK